MKQRNSEERAGMLAARAQEQRERISGRVLETTPHKSHSTRGMKGETWRTKKWTAARMPEFAK